MKKFVFMLLFAMVLTGCTEAPVVTEPVEENVVTEIGVLLPLSGDAAAYGEEAKAILDAKVEEMEGIELVYEDSKCDTAAAVTALQKLVSVDGIEYLIGGLCSNETLAIANQLEGLGAVAISPSSSNPEIEGVSMNQFSLSYKDSDVGSVLVEKISEFGKVAIISEQNEYSIGLRNAVVDGVGKDKVVVNETFESTVKDYRNIIEKVKASDAEAVFLNPFVGENASLLLSQIEELGGFGEKELFGQAAFVPSELLAEKGSVIEGMIIVDAPSVYGEKSEAFAASMNEAGVSYDNLGGYYAAAYVDALNILAEVSAKGDVEMALEALRSDTFAGLIGAELSFGKNSFVQGVGVGEFVVKDSKLERL